MGDCAGAHRRCRGCRLTVEEYEAELEAIGLFKTDDETNITRIYLSKGGTEVSVPKPEGLNDQDRAAVMQRLKMYLGIGYPKFLGPH